MARLDLKVMDGSPGWLEMRLEALASDPEDGLIAHVSFSRGGNDRLFSMTGSTEGWQVARVYFEVLGRSFVRAAEFARAHFPVSYYPDPASQGPACTLHHDLEWMHLLSRGLRGRFGLGIDCFLLDPKTKQFVHFDGRCTLESAERFGEELLKELDAL